MMSKNQEQIFEHILAPNGGYCIYYPSNLFRNPRGFENWGIFMNDTRGPIAYSASPHGLLTRGPGGRRV